MAAFFEVVMKLLNIIGLKFSLGDGINLISSTMLAPFIEEAEHIKEYEIRQCIKIERVPKIEKPYPYKFDLQKKGRTRRLYNNCEHAIYFINSDEAIVGKTMVTVQKNILIQIVPTIDKNTILDPYIFLKHLALETSFLNFNRLILHASLIGIESNAIAFSAPKQTGKSTQATLWEKYKGAEIINGDRTGIAVEPDQAIMAYGLPFAGTSGIYKNMGYPLRAIVILEQGNTNTLRKALPLEAFTRLFPEINLDRSETYYVDKAIRLLESLVSRIPVYVLKCRPDEEAVELLYSELFKKEMRYKWQKSLSNQESQDT